MVNMASFRDCPSSIIFNLHKFPNCCNCVLPPDTTRQAEENRIGKAAYYGRAWATPFAYNSSDFEVPGQLRRATSGAYAIRRTYRRDTMGLRESFAETIISNVTCQLFSTKVSDSRAGGFLSIRTRSSARSLATGFGNRSSLPSMCGPEKSANSGACSFLPAFAILIQPAARPSCCKQTTCK